MSDKSRFTDNPFRPPNLSPEQVAKLDERMAAIRIYQQTGDRGPAIKAGLFLSDEEKKRLEADKMSDAAEKPPHSDEK